MLYSNVGKYTIGGHLWGMGACAYTINGTGTGICVLVPCLTHPWVWARSYFNLARARTGVLCTQVSIANEGLNERNTLPSTGTFSETDFQQHVVRRL